MRKLWLLAGGLVVALAATVPALALHSQEGTISTVAGTGAGGRSGDGGPATAAEIGHPRGVTAAPDGGFVFTEPFNGTVRRVAPDGTITTIAGTGVPGDTGDGGPAVLAQLRLPHAVSFTPTGGLLIADATSHRIRLVAPDGTISTSAGTGLPGFAGDGGAATSAQLDTPRSVVALADGSFLIADTGNQRIRRVGPDGLITTVAGSGTRGFAGDGGPATAASLANPFAAAPTRDGGFLIADTGNDRIRRVGPDGIISTVAGTGVPAYSGDAAPAVTAALNDPHAVATLPDGGFLIADTANNRVRRVAPDGTISTAAGTGVAGYAGDGGPAGAAQLNQPKAVAALPLTPGFLVGDSVNNRIRLVLVSARRPFTLRTVGPPLRTRVGREATLRFLLSERATLRLDVTKRGKLVLRIRATRNAGRNAIAFGRRLKSGTYRVVLVATSADGRRSTTAASLKIRA